MAARKRTRRKATRTKATTRGPRIALNNAPARTRKAILSGIRRLLRDNRIDGDVVQLQVAPTAGRADTVRAEAAPAAAARAGRVEAAPPVDAQGPCPPGQVRRVVCFFQQGTFVCEEQCVPV